MKVLNLRDGNFSHQTYSSKFGTSNTLTWDRFCTQTGPTVYTDYYLNDNIRSIPGDKIAWLLEPVSIHGPVYGWVVNNPTIFKEIWTHDLEMLNAIPNGKWVPTAGCWIEEVSLFEKTKICSFIASNKNWTAGHQLRQNIRAILPANIDQFGKGYKDLSIKLDGIKDYAYSITVENIKRDTYFSEKIIDCFLTGTIPIYWGTNKISEHFNMNGILMFDTIDELNEILRNISMEDYQNRIDAVRENFETAQKFIIPEEWGIKSF